MLKSGRIRRLKKEFQTKVSPWNNGVCSINSEDSFSFH